MQKLIVLIFMVCIVKIINVNACWSELYYSVLSKDQQKVEEILYKPGLSEEERAHLINAREKNGQTPLHGAVIYSTEEIIETLLRFHPQQDIHDKHGFLPIHYAAVNGNIPTAKLLLHHGATPNDLTSCKETPLLVASYNYKSSMAKFFLESGANPNTQNSDGKTPLHWAAYTDDRDLVLSLLQHDAWITLQNHDGLAPTDHASESILTLMRKYHKAHKRALREMFAFVDCLHDRIGINSAAHEMLPELLKHIYWQLKQYYYKAIQKTSTNNQLSQ